MVYCLVASRTNSSAADRLPFTLISNPATIAILSVSNLIARQPAPRMGGDSIQSGEENIGPDQADGFEFINYPEQSVTRHVCALSQQPEMLIASQQDMPSGLRQRERETVGH